MRILIVGGNGFIGSHLTDYLVAKNQLVRVYDRSLNPYRKTLDEVEYFNGDFSDINLLQDAVKGIDIVYQLVSSTVPSTSNNDPSGDVSSNVINMLKFLDICLNASVRKVIFPSSGGTVYGFPQKLPIPETHPTNPISSYGITKLTTEKYLSLFNYLYGLDYTVFRISNPYGPRQNPNGKIGAITIFLHRILRGLPIQIWGDGKITRDYIYISDVVEALYAAQNSNLSEQIFNIGSGQGITLNDLVEKIHLVVKRDFQVNYIQGRKVDVPINFLDVSKAYTNLNWKPNVQLNEGIEQTWRWLNTL